METPAVSSPTLAADVQKVIAPVAPKKSVWEKTLSEWITFFFKRWWALCLLVAETIFTNIVTQIHGNSAQLWIYLQQHFPIPVIAILLTAIAPFIALQEGKVDEQKFRQEGATSHSSHGKASALDNIVRQIRHVLSTLVIPIVVPVVTTTLFLILLLLVLLRPVWCPGFICSPPQTKVATYPGRVNDQNLDAYFLTQQSTSFELPGTLQQYSLQNLPRTIAAVRSDNGQSSPYRLVIGVQNLHQTGYEIYIDAVTVVVYAVPPLAHPLNVWNSGSLTYNTSPYHVTYAGEPAGSVLGTTYEPVPHLTGIHQRLRPGETDDIDLQIDPAHNLQADLQFQVRITYRMANEDQEHTLTLPNLFEVVFSDASNWYPRKF